MAQIVSEFFGLVGVDMLPPSNMSELIPYLCTFFVGVVLVTSVFRVIGAIAKGLIANSKRV